jgi:hypothetical protein
MHRLHRFTRTFTLGLTAGLLAGLTASLLAGCSASSDAAPPVPSALPVLAAAPSAPVTADAIPPPPEIAPPLSERAARALSIDRMQRFDDAIDGRYPGPPHETVDDTFIVVSGEPSVPLERTVKVTRETVDALWSGPYFVHRPEKAVVAWVTCSPAAMFALAREHAPAMHGTGLGMYDPQSRQIFVALVPSGYATYVHELIHPMFRADFPLAPSWVSEGLPALFESSKVEPNGTFAFGAHFRLQTLRTALTQPDFADEVKLDALFTWTTDDAFRKHEALHYGVAREALRWLHSQGLLWPFYRAWRDGVLDDPTGERAFEAVVHMNPAQATERWRAWLQSVEAEGDVPTPSATFRPRESAQ